MNIEAQNGLVLRHHGVLPFPQGMRALMAATKLPCTVVSQCDCTSPLLHYLVKLKGGAVMTAQHREICPVDMASH